ncbi:hypothetical protein [Borreliella valaisiana]|uniref:hypothetical protein n=1 Tax=Borreliella valaisiana TaxID=62088 RepID=UPI0004E7F30E|nr:hypothetical protein P613_04610 [Borreliella valaisiana Tom4006]
MVKKIIFISFLVFMMSCNAIGRGVLIDSVLNKVVKDLDRESEEEEKKENLNSKPSINENADDDSEEEDDDDIE